MNREQIREEVYDRLGVDSADAQMGAATVNRLVNAALHFIEVKEDWPWLQYPAAPNTPNLTTVANVDLYAPPTDWLRVKEVVYLDATGVKWPLEMWTIRELDERWSSNRTGPPSDWGIYADQVVIRPVPDGVYSIIVRYIRREPDLLDDNATPLMPSSFHSAICEIASWMAFRRLQQDERATVAFEAWKEWEGEMLSHRRRFSGPSRIRVRPGGFEG